MKRKLNLAVLISGRGSNLQSIIDACADPEFPAVIKVVISNVPNVYGLERAKNANIKAVTIPHQDFASKSDFETALLHVISQENIDLICLAGFMRLLSPVFIKPWAGRIINIHPSLLPKYKGLHTHQRAIDEGEFEAGCSIHFVIPEMDEGEILLQQSVSIYKGDTADTLAARVLIEEHKLYPAAIQIMAKKLFR